MTNENQQQANIPTRPPFEMIIQYIKDQSFENINPVENFLKEQPEGINVKPSFDVASVEAKPGVHEVVLDIRMEFTNNADKPMFISELKYAALVHVNIQEYPDLPLDFVLNGHIANMMYPYARSIMASTIRDGGFTGFTMPLYDFVELYHHKNAAQEQVKATA